MLELGCYVRRRHYRRSSTGVIPRQAISKRSRGQLSDVRSCNHHSLSRCIPVTPSSTTRTSPMSNFLTQRATQNSPSIAMEKGTYRIRRGPLLRNPENVTFPSNQPSRRREDISAPGPTARAESQAISASLISQEKRLILLVMFLVFATFCCFGTAYYPHDRKGGGLIVKIPNFCEETLSECLFEIGFSHNTLMVKLLVCRVRHEEYQGSPTTLLNLWSPDHLNFHPHIDA